MLINIILLIVSVGVHTITFFGIDPQAEFPLVWLLHPGIFLAFIPLLVIHWKETGERFGKMDHALVMKYAPEWMKIFCRVLTVYAVINFGLCLVLLDGGATDIWDERYVLHSHGELIREVSAEEFRSLRSYEVRLFSGHWMIFYFYPIVGYWSYLNREEITDNE